MERPVLRYLTDTAHPQTIVPIYFVHSITQPCCSQPGCWCRASQPAIARLFGQISKGELQVRPAADFEGDSPSTTGGRS
jgi:hypothetical protein